MASVHRLISGDGPVSAIDSSGSLFHVAVFIDYRRILEINCHWMIHAIWSFYVRLVRWFQQREISPGAPQWVALWVSLLLTVTGYAQADGANCSSQSPCTISLPPASCLNVLVFLGFWVSTFCSLHHLTAAGKGGKLPPLEVGSLDYCSLLQRDFVFRITESNDLRKRILNAKALPSSFKAFYKLQFIKHNNRLRSVVWPL